MPSRSSESVTASRHESPQLYFRAQKEDAILQTMSRKASVGVAVATYNQDAYLKECLESIARQSYPVSQVVICDDCSSDNTPEVIAEFAAACPCPIEVIRFERNIGSPAKTFNTALVRLSTDYVALLCGDDLWPGDKVEKELRALAREPKARFAYCGMLSIDEHGGGAWRRYHAHTTYGRRHTGADSCAGKSD